MFLAWSKIANLHGQLVSKDGENLELFAKPNLKSMAELSQQLVDGSLPVRFVRIVATNGASWISVLELLLA
jgi:hypothetical protein